MEGNASVSGWPRIILRLEAVAVLIAALWAFHSGTQSWWLFVILILAPDLSALGYLAGSRVGGFCYNAAHTYVFPIILGAWGVAAGQPLALSLALIWTAHIAADRALGYGLKYPDAFGSTHMGCIGKAASPAP